MKEIFYYIYIFGFCFTILEGFSVMLFVPWAYFIGFSVSKHKIKASSNSLERLGKETMKTKKGAFRVKGNRIYAKNRYHKRTTEIKGIAEINSSGSIEFHFRTMLGTPLMVSSFSIMWLWAAYSHENYDMILITLIVIILSFFWTRYATRKKAKRLIDEFLEEVS